MKSSFEDAHHLESAGKIRALGLALSSPARRVGRGRFPTVGEVVAFVFLAVR